MATTQPSIIARLVYAYVYSHPGCNANHIVCAFALPKGSIHSILASLEIPGWFLYEDDDGGLWVA